MRIPGPARERESQRFRQRLTRELVRAASGRFRENRGKDVRSPRAVFHRASGIAHHRPVEREPHPVPAADPGSVVLPARRRQARSHRQQVLDRDRLLAFVGILAQLREPADDRLVEAANQLAVDGYADQRGNDALRRGLDVRQARRAVLGRVVLEDEPSTVADGERVELGEGGRRRSRSREVLRCGAGDDRRDGRDSNEELHQEDGTGPQRASTVPISPTIETSIAPGTANRMSA